MSITPLQDGFHWTVKKGEITQEKGTSITCAIDLIKCIGVANKEHRKELAAASVKLQSEIADRNILVRIFLTVAEYLLTRTTLYSATLRLKEGDNLAKLTYPKIMSQAESITDKETYEAVAATYKPLSIHSQINNPLLYEMRQAIVSEWKKMRSLMMEGKTLEDPEVKECVDIIIQIIPPLFKLANTYHHPAYPHHLGYSNQAEYTFHVISTISTFFQWISSNPRYESANWTYELKALPADWQAVFDDIKAELAGKLHKDNYYLEGELRVFPSGQEYVVEEKFLTIF